MDVRPKIPIWLVITCCLLLGLLSGLLLAAFVTRPATQGPKQASIVTPKTVVVAGDISCEPGAAITGFTCRSGDTAALISSLKPDAVLTAGDNQYPVGAPASFQDSYDKTWGKFKNNTYPVPGNHDYDTADAAGYYGYFGDRAGERGKGYYAFSVGAWRFLALNSEIDVSANSPQLSWVQQELQNNKSTCTLAYWHKPRFSTGGHASDPTYDALWRTLYASGVDVVVNGHSHAYERFVPQNPDAQPDQEKGITEFVSGMGGRSVEPLQEVVPTLATRQNHAFGVLQFSLYPKSAKYAFVTAPGQQTFSDSGTIQCH